jgi:hypothetical protein
MVRRQTHTHTHTHCSGVVRAQTAALPAGLLCPSAESDFTGHNCVQLSDVEIGVYTSVNVRALAPTHLFHDSLLPMLATMFRGHPIASHTFNRYSVLSWERCFAFGLVTSLVAAESSWEVRQRQFF